MWETWNDVFRAGRAQLRQRAARPPKQLGPPETLLRRLRLSRARHHEPAADRRLGSAGRRRGEAQDGAAARPLRRTGARRTAQAGQSRHRERRRDPEAVARGRDAAPGRRQRPVPAGRVRRRPPAGEQGRRPCRIPRPGRVLSAHLPDREPQGHARRRGAAAHRRRRRPGRQAADQLRRRQDPLDARALPPLLGECRSEQAVGRRRVDAGRRRLEAAEGEPRGPGGQPYLAGQSGHQAGRHGGAHAVGRAGLPVGRRGGLCARRQGRRARHEPGRHPARAPRRVRAVPDPDRRMGRLRAPAARPERPAGRQLRDPVHLRPGADRIREAGRQLPARRQPPGVGHFRFPAHAVRRHRGGRPARPRGARAPAQRRRAHRVVVAGRPAPKRDSRSSAGGCSSRSPTRPGSRTATSSPAPSPTSTAASSRSFRPSAAMPTTSSASRPPIPFIRRSSTACTPTGRRW